MQSSICDNAVIYLSLYVRDRSIVNYSKQLLLLILGIMGNEDNHRFTDTWDQVYSGSSLQIPWYVVAGNHDHIGNVTAQISYSALSNRWNFPSLYYSKIFVAKDGSLSVQVIFIDTVDLAGKSSNTLYKLHYVASSCLHKS